jgi:hypothetical protein
LRGWQTHRRWSPDVTVEQIKERTTRPVTEKVCAEPALDAGKRSGGPRSQLTEPLEPDGPWKNLNKSAFDCRGRPQLVKMGGIPSLERFQAQSIWEISN